MNIRLLLTAFIIGVSASMYGQTQTWQWVKSGGSSSDNNGVQPAECKIAGCDAYGNVYAVGNVNGPNMRFDTFSSPGSYSVTGVGISYLLFSYDCAGNMRWAKQIGDEEGDLIWCGAVTDPQGNTYFAAQFWYGYNGGLVRLFLGDTTIVPTAPMVTQPYLCMVKYDSLGRLIWFKNFQEDTAYNPHVGSLQTIPFGLRIGSSGNLWMGCGLDSDYAISPNLHTTLKGNYNVEVDLVTGNILGGYYTSNKSFGDVYSTDTYYDLDVNENYYATGYLNSYGGLNPDTLILANQIVTPDPSQTAMLGYIYSLDKHGNLRFIITNKNYGSDVGFTSCKYDYIADKLVVGWFLDSGIVFKTDTFGFNTNSVNSTSTVGLFAIDTTGDIRWAKYLTQNTNPYAFIFAWIPTTAYIDNTIDTGVMIYNNADTLFNYTNLSSTTFVKVISRIDANGNIIKSYVANEGTLGNLSGSNGIKYGATDWRGNVYLGGTITNFFATAADSVVNTDQTSGNFFIAKLGISDCSCPTPGVQFTQTSHGDTIHFYGSSINHADSIHWRLGDGTLIHTDTFTHVYAHDSTYTVTAIANSGCGIDSITKQITVRSTGIKTIEPDKTNLYPNPVKNIVNLEVSAPATIGLVFANGASVWQGPIQVSQQGTYVFDMGKYSGGLYYFIVQYTSGKVDVVQVVKE